MLYKELEVGDKVYKCRMSAKQMVALEDKMGCSPLGIFKENEATSLKDLLTMFHAMLQEYHHGIKMDDVYNIYDEYCSEGDNSYESFVVFIIKVLQNNGYISRSIDFDNVGGDEAKNA